ncbi:MAG: Transcriptional regulator [Rhodospirillales bacterium]|nr:Transcriptional regulator [Rhodospirillales bacterium]
MNQDKRPRFEFDYIHNKIYYNGIIIRLSPHESDILRVLLNNRARPTPVDTLIRMVYGYNEPDTAAASIRVALHSLRKKIQVTGMTIRAQSGVGYEIDASAIPELNRRLSDRILLALNLARATNEIEISHFLELALKVSEESRKKWLDQNRGLTISQSLIAPASVRTIRHADEIDDETTLTVQRLISGEIGTEEALVQPARRRRS